MNQRLYMMKVDTDIKFLTLSFPKKFRGI